MVVKVSSACDWKHGRSCATRVFNRVQRSHARTRWVSTAGRGGTHHPTPQGRNLAAGGEQARESQAHSNIHTCNAGRVMIVFILPECSGPPPCALVPRVPVWGGKPDG